MTKAIKDVGFTVNHLVSASNGGRDRRFESIDIPAIWIGNVIDSIDIIKHIGIHPICSICHGKKQTKMLVHRVHGFIGLEVSRRYAEYLDTMSTDDLRKKYLRWMVASTTSGQVCKGMLQYDDMVTKGKLTQDEFAQFCHTNYRHTDYARITGSSL